MWDLSKNDTRAAEYQGIFLSISIPHMIHINLALELKCVINPTNQNNITTSILNCSLNISPSILPESE
jgi:hypothetical protein